MNAGRDALRVAGSRVAEAGALARAAGWRLVRRVGHAVRELPPFNFDRLHGVDTRGVDEPGEPGASAAEGAGYEATSPKLFAFATGFVPRPLSNFAFVDLGSGKGRVVLLAARLPFRSVTGVEISPRLHAVALANLERYRGRRRCSRVDLVLGDAAAYEPPPGDVVVFIYNPFGGDLFRRLVSGLEASFRASPRRMIVLYNNPVEAEALDGSAVFRRVFAGEGPPDRVWRSCRQLRVYSAGP